MPSRARAVSLSSPSVPSEPPAELPRLSARASVRDRLSLRVRFASWLPALALSGAVLVAFQAPRGARAQVLERIDKARPVESPVSLTASDGAGLELVSYKATAVVQDPLGFTELHLVFRNPENRVREGRFRIALPPGAAVSRFAMKMDTSWQEGEVVEKQAARAAYEDALHRRQDPALLENEAGNEFSARVFPIPAGATKELILSYSEELGQSGQPYRLALRGLPRMTDLDIHVILGSSKDSGPAPSSLGGTTLRQEVVELKKSNFEPDRDFELPRTGTGAVGLRGDNALVARVRPLAEDAKPASMSALEVLVDTSASRALGFDDELARVRAVLAALAKGGDFPVTVTAFDQEVVSLWSGQASAYPASVDDKLRARQALGASHLAGVLGKVTSKGRVLLVTDGLATAGPTGGDELRAAVQKLGARGVERLDVLAVGGLRDDEMLRRLISAGLAHAGRLLMPDESPAQIASRLRRETSGDLAVSVEGATWFWPTHVQGLQAGDEIVVYADVPAQKEVRMTVGGKVPAAMPAAWASAERPLLLRALTQARLSRIGEQRDVLAAGDEDLREGLRRQMIELSVKNRVLCRETALVVLETENDYARFGIDRRALADILTVGAKGLEVVHRAARTPVQIAQPIARLPRPIDDLADGSKGGDARRRGAAKAKKESADREAGEGSRQGATPTPAAPAAAPKRMAAREEKSSVSDEVTRGRSAAGAAPPASPALAGGAPAVAMAPEPMPAPPPPPTRVAASPVRAPAASRPRAAPAPREMDDLQEAPAEDRVLAERPSPRTARLARNEDNMPKGVPAWDGKFAQVMGHIARGNQRAALDEAQAWRKSSPGDVLALVALGEALEHAKQPGQAARAYGAIVDLFPGRADLRRYAGGYLERLQGKLGAAAIDLATDVYRKAAADRPDHPSSHRLLAFALLKAGRNEEAFEVLVKALAQNYPDGRFRGVIEILQEDLGLVASVWAAQEPARATAILERLRAAGGTEERGPSLRFVLTWETDANDVDFHIIDGRKGHAFYSQPELASGGHLYADVTTGYGPECFTVRTPENARAYPYVLQAHYYSRGPMGYGMGKLQVLNHDGKGHIRFNDRPFVVMADNAFVDLGRIQRGD